MKNAGFAFFLGAIIALPGEVFSSLAKLRTFFTDKSGNVYIVGWFIPICGEKNWSVENTLRLLREDEAIPD